MAGLPGIRNLRLHPNEQVDRTQEDGSLVTNNNPAGSNANKDATVSFKDLATLVAVLLDRNRGEGEGAPPLCQREQGALRRRSIPVSCAQSVRTVHCHWGRVL
jgi:hypothetical protein